MTSYVKVDESIGQSDPRVFFGLNTVEPTETQFLRVLKDLRYDIYTADGTLASGTGKTFQDPAGSVLGLRPSILAADTVLDDLQHFSGLYVAAFVVAKFEADGTPVPGPDYSAITGDYEVRWSWSLVVNDVTTTGVAITKLTVLDPTAVVVDGPVQIAEAVAAGFILDETEVLPNSFTSLQLKEILERGFELAEHFTETTFGAKVGSYRTHGDDSDLLESPTAMAGLSSIDITVGDSSLVVRNTLAPTLEGSYTALTESVGDFTVPNRHIRFAQRGWDKDRIRPQIERKYGNFGIESALVDLKGVFGVTTADGTVWGRVPPEVTRALIILAAANAFSAYDQGVALLPGTVGPLKSIQTDVQKFQYYAPGTDGSVGGSSSSTADMPSTAHEILSHYRKKLVNVVF